MKAMRKWTLTCTLFISVMCFAQTVDRSDTNSLPAEVIGESSINTNSQSYTQLHLLFAGLTAIGTIAIAILAIFGNRIRSWIIRPRIKLAVGEASPFIERIEKDDSSTEDGKNVSYKIRLEIQNIGREVARNSSVLCNTVHRQRDVGSGFYELKKFVPKQFFWTTRDQRLDVTPKIPSYLSIAEISEPTQSVSGNDQNLTVSQERCLQIRIEAEGVKGRFYRVKNGKILFPAIFYTDNLPKPIMHYIEICWNGTSVDSFSAENFQIQLLSEKAGKELLGGGK